MSLFLTFIVGLIIEHYFISEICIGTMMMIVALVVGSEIKDNTDRTTMILLLMLGLVGYGFGIYQIIIDGFNISELFLLFKILIVVFIVTFTTIYIKYKKKGK